MKLRQQAKRTAAMRAKRPKHVPWTAEEVACMEHALQSLLDTDILVRALSLPRVKQSRSFAVWPPSPFY